MITSCITSSNPNCDSADYTCIVNNCSGAIGSGQTLFNYWNTHNCPAAYRQLINSIPGCTGTCSGILQYNATSQLKAQCYVNNLFTTYLADGTYKITDSIFPADGYNPFQNTLLDLCIDPTLPGVCGQFLSGGFCPSDRNSVIPSPVLTNFCGCYTSPDPDYLQYTLGSPECNIGSTGCTAGCTAGNTGCTGQPACDPLCHRALTSHKAYQPDGNIITCPQKICVINDVTINATNSEVQGGINFNTVCPGCAGPTNDGCLCIVSGENISSTMSDIGVGPNFNFFCGASSVCLVEDSQGNIISATGCSGIDFGTLPVESFPVHPNYGILVIIIIVLILVLFVTIAARASKSEVHMPRKPIIEYPN